MGSEEIYAEVLENFLVMNLISGQFLASCGLKSFFNHKKRRYNSIWKPITYTYACKLNVKIVYDIAKQWQNGNGKMFFPNLNENLSHKVNQGLLDDMEL